MYSLSLWAARQLFVAAYVIGVGPINGFDGHSDRCSAMVFSARSSRKLHRCSEDIAEISFLHSVATPRQQVCPHFKEGIPQRSQVGHAVDLDVMLALAVGERRL